MLDRLIPGDLVPVNGRERQVGKRLSQDLESEVSDWHIPSLRVESEIEVDCCLSFFRLLKLRKVLLDLAPRAVSRGLAKKGKTVAPLAAGQGGEGALCDCGLRHLELANWGGSTEARPKYRYEAMTSLCVCKEPAVCCLVSFRDALSRLIM